MKHAQAAAGACATRGKRCRFFYLYFLKPRRGAGICRIRYMYAYILRPSRGSRNFSIRIHELRDARLWLTSLHSWLQPCAPPGRRAKEAEKWSSWLQCKPYNLIMAEGTSGKPGGRWRRVLRVAARVALVLWVLVIVIQAVAWRNTWRLVHFSSPGTLSGHYVASSQPRPTENSVDATSIASAWCVEHSVSVRRDGITLTKLRSPQGFVSLNLRDRDDTWLFSPNWRAERMSNAASNDSWYAFMSSHWPFYGSGSTNLILDLNSAIPFHWSGINIGFLWLHMLLGLPSCWIILSNLGDRRRRKRLSAGCCVSCGYDLRGTRAAGRVECPECGTAAPVTPRA